MSIINLVAGTNSAPGLQSTPAVKAKAGLDKPAVAKAPPPPPPPPPPPRDKVHLTASAQAQAKALKEGGETPAQIAFTMNTDVRTVEGYLSVQTPAATPPPKAPAVQTAPAQVDIKA